MGSIAGLVSDRICAQSSSCKNKQSEVKKDPPHQFICKQWLMNLNRLLQQEALKRITWREHRVTLAGIKEWEKTHFFNWAHDKNSIFHQIGWLITNIITPDLVIFQQLRKQCEFYNMNIKRITFIRIICHFLNRRLVNKTKCKISTIASDYYDDWSKPAI